MNQIESINTLKFGIKAKSIKTKFSVNKGSSKQIIETEFSKHLEIENQKLKVIIKELENELKVRLFEPMTEQQVMMETDDLDNPGDYFKGLQKMAFTYDWEQENKSIPIRDPKFAFLYQQLAYYECQINEYIDKLSEFERQSVPNLLDQPLLEDPMAATVQGMKQKLNQSLKTIELLKNQNMRLLAQIPNSIEEPLHLPKITPIKWLREKDLEDAVEADQLADQLEIQQQESHGLVKELRVQRDVFDQFKSEYQHMVCTFLLL